MPHRKDGGQLHEQAAPEKKNFDFRDRIMVMLDNSGSENNARVLKVRDVIARENMKSN